MPVLLIIACASNYIYACASNYCFCGEKRVLEITSKYMNYAII